MDPKATLLTLDQAIYRRAAVAHTYAVHTDEFGTLLKVADSIADARRWAKQFAGATVSRFRGQPQCDAAHKPCFVRKEAQ